MGNKMRLACPNCAAQYEIDEELIPVAGRDVQCSNCSHTWWQMRDGAQVQAEPPDQQIPGEPPEGGASADRVDPQPAIEDQPVPEPVEPEMASVEEIAPADTMPGATEEEVAFADVADREEDEASEPEPFAAAPLDTPPRRTLDEAVLDVLRQEAEREARAREAEAAQLGRAQPVAPAQMSGVAKDDGLRARMDIAKALDPAGTEPVEGDAPPPPRPRVPVLPDIEEINSTLEPSVAPTVSEVAIAAATQRRTGFRLGFTLMMLVTAGIALVYGFRDSIVASAPELEPQVAAITQRLESGRQWLDMAALNASDVLRNLANE